MPKNPTANEVSDQITDRVANMNYATQGGFYAFLVGSLTQKIPAEVEASIRLWDSIQARAGE